MPNPLHIVELTAAELLQLGGPLRPEVQAHVDVARAVPTYARTFGVSHTHALLLALTEQAALWTGRLGITDTTMPVCPVCKTDPGYAKFTRTTRKHRAGDDDRSKPLSLYGVMLGTPIVRVVGWYDLKCCDVCWTTLRPHLTTLLADVPAEVPQAITGHAPRWKRWPNMRCTSCGWEGHEGEMGEMTAMLEGKYRGACPKCPAKNTPLGVDVLVPREGFMVVGV